MPAAQCLLTAASNSSIVPPGPSPATTVVAKGHNRHIVVATEVAERLPHPVANRNEERSAYCTRHYLAPSDAGTISAPGQRRGVARLASALALKQEHLCMMLCV